MHRCKATDPQLKARAEPPGCSWLLQQHTALLDAAVLGPVVAAMTQPTAMEWPGSGPCVTGTAQGQSSIYMAQGHCGGTNIAQEYSSSTSTAQGCPISICQAWGHSTGTHSPVHSACTA